jgi:subtilisin-like proprotein convertase family protein
MKIWSFLISMLLFTSEIHSACDKPRLPNIIDLGMNSVGINWKDNNSNVLGYQLAHNLKGQLLKDAKKSALLGQKSGTLTNLISGTSYSFWIRTVCGINDTSKWEGPFTFTTLISNPSRCEMNLDIKDNSCDSPLGNDEFLIEVSGINGSNVYLESVSLIIAHSWPADLKISLENPQGKSIILSNENGTLTDDIGIINGSCDKACVFSLAACNSIKEGKPPFEGNFEPEESLLGLYTENPNGIWKLKICDGALNDKGILKHVALNFNPILCNIVENFYISRLTNKSFEVVWDIPDNCDQMEVYFKKKSDQNFVKKQFVTCNVGRTSILNLEENQEYDFYLVSGCSSTSKSSPSCIRSITTLCNKPDINENFDVNPICDISCDVNCKLDGIFFNSSSDDLDWLINEKNTPTEFTGPSEGVFGGGKYLYVESNPTLCGANAKAILESKCLKANGNSTSCDLSFFYHMYGKDIGSLNFEKSVDNGLTWVSVYELNGNQKNEWLEAKLDLGLTANQSYKLRIQGKIRDGAEGDIAIDQLNITNGNISAENIYYKDNDGDGYGTRTDSIKGCLTNIPIGYALLAGDCNDNDIAYNPQREDIPCNLIDENCDGKLDLEDENNPLTVANFNIINETCKGKNDGEISIEVTGGTPPYKYKWINTSIDNKKNSGLGSGLYKCEITDINGCGIETKNYEIKTISNISILTTSIVKPSCKGVKNGEINISHNGIYPPFKFSWSNGDTLQNVINVSDGFYKLTVTDALGCKAESDKIELISNSSLNAINSYKKLPLCFGDKTGILDFDVIGGVPPFQFLWEDGYNKKRRDQLAGGIYKLTITDAQNCISELSGNIKEPDSLSIKVVNIEDVRCFGKNSGQIKLKVSGGIGPYDFEWNDGVSQPNRNNISAGNYWVKISDSNGCQTEKKEILIKQADSLFYVIDSLKDASCLKKSDGAIYTSIFGGLKPYNYFWSNGPGINGSNQGLLPLSYTLTVVDNNNCKLTTDVIKVVNVNKPYDINIVVGNQNACPKSNEATIIAKSILSKSPLDFNWSNGTQLIKDSKSDTLTKLGSGLYNVTITDAEACVSISNFVEIYRILDFNASIDVTKNTCNNDTQGAISIAVAGGKMPYNYEWSNGAKTSNLSQLGNGIFKVTLTDANDCKYTSPDILVSSISNLDLIVTTIGSPLNKKEGEALISPFGGKGSYLIQWQDPTIGGFNPQKLGIGIYPFSVIDELGCRLDSTMEISILSDVTEQQNRNSKIFPNPLSSECYIIANEEIVDLVLQTSTGIRSYPRFVKLSDKKYQLYVEDISKGFYFIEVLSFIKL